MRLLSLCVLLVAGCAGGPTHDYYSPVVSGAKYHGQPVMHLSETFSEDKEKLLAAGYSIIGTTDYYGKYPDAAELKAQAGRVGANYILYACERIESNSQAWRMSFGSWGGRGGSVGDQYKVRIAFLGK